MSRGNWDDRVTHSETAALWIAIAISSMAFAILGYGLAVIRSRTKSVITKALGTVLLIVICVMSPMVVDWLIAALYATEGALRVYIDPGPVHLWLPAACTLAAYILAWRGSKRAMRHA